MTSVTQFASHVQPHEAAEARALIDSMFIRLTGKPFEFKTCGYLVTVKVHIRPEEIKTIKRADGTEYTLVRAHHLTAQHDKYQSVAGLVVGIGPEAFKRNNPDGSQMYSAPWCHVGDWVTIPRYEAHLFTYRGVALGILPDDRIMGVISDPADVEPIHMSDKF